MKIWTPLDTTGSISPHELDDVARMHSKVNLKLSSKFPTPFNVHEKFGQI